MKNRLTINTKEAALDLISTFVIASLPACITIIDQQWLFIDTEITALDLVAAFVKNSLPSCVTDVVYI